MVNPMLKAAAMKVGSGGTYRKNKKTVRATMPKPQVASRRTETNRRTYGSR